MKIGHKARRGRHRSHPVPHKDHRKKGRISDPISRALKKIQLEQARKDEARFEYAAEHDGRPAR